MFLRLPVCGMSSPKTFLLGPYGGGGGEKNPYPSTQYSDFRT